MPGEAEFIDSEETCLLKLTKTSKAVTSVELLTKRTRARVGAGGRLLSASTRAFSAPADPVRTIDESVAGAKLGLSVKSVAPGVAVASTANVGEPATVF